MRTGTIGLLCLAAMSAPVHAQPVVMRNGAQLTTVDGAVVQAHGAGVLKVGRYYYMVGENRAGYRFRAVSLYRSVDLGRWEFRRDILTPAHHTYAIKDRVPHARVRVWQKMGHAPFWEITEEFNRVQLEFMEES